MAVVREPSLPPLIIQRSGRKYAYVMTYRNKWVDGRCRRVESRKVGKIEGGVDALPNGRVKWDDAFVAEHPELRSFDTWRRPGGFDFKPRDGELPVEKPRRQEGCRLHAGATWALECIAAESNIGRALASVFSKYHAHMKILSVAFYMVLRATNSIHGYGPFAEASRLPWGGVLSDSSISRLFQRIGEDDVDAFFKKLNALNARALGDGEPERVFLALDSTSISTSARNLSQAEWGHNKDGDRLRQVNVLFLADQKTGLPLFYRLHTGSTPDVSTMRRVLADSARLGGPVRKCVLVADRGYPSEANISDCLRNNVSFLFRVPSSQPYFKSYVAEVRGELSDANNYNDYIGQFATTVEADWRYDGFEVDGKRTVRRDRARVWLHIYYNPGIHEDARNVLLANASRARDQYNARGSVEDGYKSFIESCCTIDNETNVAAIDNRKVEKMLENRGVAVLISDEIKDPIDAWLHYADRGAVEQAFHTLKSRLACDRFRVSKDRSLTGKMLVQFVATSLLIMVRRRLADYERFRKSRQDKFRLVSLSDQTVLEYLHNVMAKKIDGGWLFDEVTGRNRRLYAALGIKPPVTAGDGGNFPIGSA